MPGLTVPLVIIPATSITIVMGPPIPKEVKMTTAVAIFALALLLPSMDAVVDPVSVMMQTAAILLQIVIIPVVLLPGMDAAATLVCLIQTATIPPQLVMVPVVVLDPPVVVLVLPVIAVFVL